MLTPAEQRLERSRMSTALVNLGEFAVYWSPRFRRLLCRSVQCQRHFGLPRDAMRVGIYSKPASAADILADLTELLESRTQAARACAAAVARREDRDA